MKKNKEGNYFKDLFKSFLLISLLPFLLSIIIIVIFQYKSRVKSLYEQMNHATNHIYSVIEQLSDDSKEIIKNIKEDEMFIKAVKDTNNPLRKEVISSLSSRYAAGLEQTVHLTIFDKSNILFSSNDIDVPFFDFKQYNEWGIIYQMTTKPDDFISFPLVYSSGELELSYAIGGALLDENDQIIGFVVTSSYRKPLIRELKNIAEDHSSVRVIDSSGVIILDSDNFRQEGLIDNDLSDSNRVELKDFTSDTFYLERILGANPIHLKIKRYQPEIMNNILQLIRISLMVYLLTFFLIVSLARRLSHYFYKPIDKTIDFINQVQEGNFKIRMNIETPHQEQKLLAEGLNEMLDTIERLNEDILEEHTRQNIAEMKYLQSQMNPHFLYNMLNEIKSLAKLGRVDEVSDFVIHLGKLLRQSIDETRSIIYLAEELEFIESYLELQMIRYDGMLSYDVFCEPEIFDVLVPPLCLQPIVENSIIHGFVEMRPQSHISISCSCKDDNLILSVTDNGVGFEKDILKQISASQDINMYGKMGLENIHKRIQLAYGTEYGISINSKYNAYTTVILTLPCKWGEDFED